MIRYVVGLAFHGFPPVVLLQGKLRPGWQAGKLNAPGGKAKEGETGLVAMSREFFEETGLLINPGEWDHFLTETARSQPADALPGWAPYTVDYFRFTYTTDNTPALGSQFVDEKVEWVSVRQKLSDRFQAVDLIGNLQWVIPMALDWRKMHSHVLLWDDIRRKGTW